MAKRIERKPVTFGKVIDQAKIDVRFPRKGIPPEERITHKQVTLGNVRQAIQMMDKVQRAQLGVAEAAEQKPGVRRLTDGEAA